MNLGININTKDGIDKANQEIKDWLKKLQGDINKSKIKIEFDIPKGLDKYFESVAKSSSKFKEVEAASDSLKDKLKELDDIWNTLTAEERAGQWGTELINSWRELSQEAGGLDSTLRQSVKTIDEKLRKITETAEKSELLSTKLKALEKDWSMLNEVERKGADGQALRDKYRELVESTGNYSSTLKSAVAQEKRFADEIKKNADIDDKKAKQLKEQAEYMRTYKGRLEELEKAWSKLDATQRKGADGQSILNQVKELNTEFGEYKGTLTQIISGEERRNKVLEKSGKVMTQLKNITASYLSVYMGIRLTKQMADVTGEFEMQKNAIAAMLNNAERAETIFKQIKTLAVVSPFEVKDLVSYAKQLTAFSVPYEELYDTTKRLADISAGLGVDMGRLILAFGQVRSSAVLRGQELRQFTEAGIPLIDELVRKFKELGEESITQADIFDKIYKRQVPFEMVRDVMFEMTEEGGKFYRMQEVQADTLKGKITNLADAYSIMMAEIGEKGSPIMKKFLDFLRDIMEHHESLTRAVLVGASAYGVARIAIMATTVSLKSLKAVIATTPWGAVAIALSGVVYAMSRHYEEAHKANKLYETMTDTIGRLVTKVQSEEAALKLVFLRLGDAEKGSANYLKIKNEIVSKYGVYMKGLSDEIDAVDDLATVYEKLKGTMLEVSRAKAKHDALESITSSYIAAEAQSWANISKLLDEKGYIGEAKAEMFKTLKDYFFDMDKVAVDGLTGIEDTINKFEERRKGLFLFGLGDQAGETAAFENRLRDNLSDILEYYKKRKQAEEDINDAFMVGEPGKGTPPVVITNYTTVNELLKKRAEYERDIAKIQGDKRTTAISDADKKSLESYNEGLEEVKKELSLLGYVEPQKGTAKVVDAVKEMLDAMKKEIDIYSTQVSIWDALAKPYDKSLETFLKEQLSKLGVEIGSKFVLDVDWKDVISGKDLEPQVEDMARSIFDTLRTNALKAFQDSEKQLKDLVDKYGTFSDKIAQINVKYQEDIQKMRDRGMSDEQIGVALSKRQSEIAAYMETYAKESEDFQTFMYSIANISEEKIGELLEKIRALMDATAEASGHDSEEYAKLNAMFDELAEKADKLKPKDKTYEQWRKLQTVLNRTSKSFDEIGDSIGGVGGEAFSLAGELATTTVSIIDSIKLLTTSSADAMEGAGDAAVTTLQKVEKASVILAIITAAIKVVQKIIEFTKKLFNRKHDREIKRQQAAIKALQNEYKQLQHEMKRAFGGDYFKQANAEVENLKKQQEALNKQMRAEQKKSSKKSKENQKELREEIMENQRQIEDALSAMVERMTGTTLASAARSFADAWADAYYSFEDTSKAIEDRFREMARNMVLENVISGRIGKILEPSFKYIENALKDGVMSESEMKVWLGMMENANKVMQSESVYWEQIVESMGDLLDRGKGESNLSGIAKGIASASEDTVLLVGGYLDSIRFKLFPYIDYMMGDFSTTISLIMNAQIQQVNYLRQIEISTRGTNSNTKELVEAINSVIEIGDNGKRLRV